MDTSSIPRLEGEAGEAARYRGGHLQIIASAGSGKTEVVSQRVVGLLAEKVAPDAIVAFTFTERAASSLKSRIEKRVSAVLGESFLDQLNGMFVGTIHSYCFRILQQHVPRYETFDVLDDHRLTAFFTRTAYALGIPSLAPKFFASIKAFAENLHVVENEMLEPGDLEDPFREVYERYVSSLEDHRFLTYGQIIARAVKELRDDAVFGQAHGPLRHLIVDEYQDINPAQEALIYRLAAPPAHLCVVGDDDQSIYQWRGSNVDNIISFRKRYPNVKSFQIEINRRSRPGIITLANDFAPSIQGRLPKSMQPHRPTSDKTEVVCWSGETPEDEARTIAKAIRSAHDEGGYLYKEIAVLCRGRVSFEKVLDALNDHGIPAQPGGRTALFLQPDADLFGRAISWLVGYDWRTSAYGFRTEPVSLKSLVGRYKDLYALSPAQVARVQVRLTSWRDSVDDAGRPANLVRAFYDLLGELGVDHWEMTDPLTVNRLGTLARCSQLLVDYESTRRRSRPDHSKPGEFVGGMDRGRKYFEWLAKFVHNWASWQLRRL